MNPKALIKGMIVLDRDGVLNRVVVHPEQGTIDSPMNPSEVVLKDGVAEALKRLHDSGFVLAIATNQPAWAKGKTSRENLIAVHEKVVSLAEFGGAQIWKSEVCFHQSGDGCTCRKPQPGMLLKLKNALQESQVGPQELWMVGDGVTDVQAAHAAGFKAAFLGPRKCDACKILDDLSLRPEFWGDNLTVFTEFLLNLQAAR